MANQSKIVYQGINHHVECDGEKHYVLYYSNMTKKKQYDGECKCKEYEVKNEDNK